MPTVWINAAEIGTCIECGLGDCGDKSAVAGRWCHCQHAREPFVCPLLWTTQGVAYLDSLSGLSEEARSVQVARGLFAALSDLKNHDADYGTLGAAWGIAAAILYLGGRALLEEVASR